MAGYVLIGMFAAFGILCSIWAVFGWLLPGKAGGVVVCRAGPGFPERFFVLRCLLLVEAGVLCCPVIIVDSGLQEQDIRWLRRFDGRIKICTPEEFSSGSELERDRCE